MGIEKPNRTVKTASTIFDIVEVLDELEKAGVTEIAESLDLAPSTVHRHLMTLVDSEYLVKEGTQYRLSLRFLQIGMHIRESHEEIKSIRPYLEQIAEESGELAWFAKEEHGYGIYVEKAEGEYAVQPYTKVGEYEYLHNVAAGKAILAFLPKSYVRNIFEIRELVEYTENTITDLDELFKELEEIREQGYAFNRGETIKNHRAVASPVLVENEVVGSIVISGPKKRMQGERFEQKLPELVSGAANAIELELQKENAHSDTL